MNYSAKFKENILQKVYQTKTKSISSIARECGVPQSTVFTWLSKINQTNMKTTQKISKIDNWSATNKLMILCESYKLSETQLGEYLRSKGVYSHQLEEWRSEAINSLSISTLKKSKKDPNIRKIKQLEKELNRKDKALAEASALLILKKKAHFLWGDEES